MKHMQRLALIATFALTIGCQGESSVVQMDKNNPASTPANNTTGGTPGQPSATTKLPGTTGPGGTVGMGTGTSQMTGTPRELPPFEPGPAQVRRLLRSEYVQAVRDLVQSPVQVPALEPDTAINGLPAIGATSLTLSRSGVDQYEAASLAVAAEVMRDAQKRQNIVTCTPKAGEEEACARQFVQEIGRKAWRRTLTKAQVDRYVGVAMFASDKLGNFWSGLEFALAGILQSPYFIYRTENGEPDPSDASRRKLTSSELATKLSFFLTGTIPDTELLDAAEGGELETKEQIQAQAKRLLQKPQAQRALRYFWIDYLEFQDFQKISKAQDLFPELDRDLAVNMREETLKVMDHLVFEKNADMRQMFTTKTTFVNRRLAKHYNLPGADELPEDEFTQITLSEDTPRAGILTHAAFLTKHSNPDSTSPTHRGLFIRQGLMCQTVSAPPPTIDTTVPPAEPEKNLITYRQRLESYTSAAQCSGCHVLMDPLGFPFEEYDAIGRLRELDNGEPVNPKGAYEEIEVNNAMELTQALGQSKKAMDCLVRKTYRQATGRVEGRGETRVIKSLSDAFEKSNYNYQALLVELVASDGFLYINTKESNQ